MHRDIKPENILLSDKELHVKIADFGLAKIVDEDSFTTTVCGTPAYVAPEMLVAHSQTRRYTRAVDIWSLGVVLYICLCGFPPFSDELRRPGFPYDMNDQIRMGIFDYPSPHWDPVSDAALDLIDHMLNVDIAQRYSVDDCLRHPWTTFQQPNLYDSTDGLVGGLEGLDFSKRRVARQRTMLADINDVKVSRVLDLSQGRDPVKVYVKNPEAKKPEAKTPVKPADGVRKEERPDEQRSPKEFARMGGKGDEVLFGESRYLPEDVTPAKDVAETKNAAAKDTATEDAANKDAAVTKGQG